MLRLLRILAPSRCVLSQSAAPATNSARGGSQSAAPATNSARQETSEYSNRNGGTDRRPPLTTADNRRQPQTTQHPQPLTEHGGSQSAAPATNSARGGSQSAAPATNSARQQTSEYSNRNGGTDRRPPPTTADNCRQPQTTQRPQPLTEHGGSQSAAPATNSGDVSVCAVTKCCACHELCAWRFTKCCACHEFCTMEERTGDHRRQPQTTADNRRQPQTTQHPQPLTEHGGSQSAAPATISARGGSQSAAPATNSARQQTSEYSNHNGGTDRRPPPTTADNRRQPQTTQHPQPLTQHGGSQSAAPATNSGDVSVCVVTVLRLPRTLHVEVHKVLRLPRILHVKKQVNTLITMEERTGDHR